MTQHPWTIDDGFIAPVEGNGRGEGKGEGEGRFFLRGRTRRDEWRQGQGQGWTRQGRALTRGGGEERRGEEDNVEHGSSLKLGEVLG